MMIYYLILSFVFVSVGLVAYQLVPLYQSRVQNGIKKVAPSKLKIAAVDELSSKLSSVFIELPHKRILYMYLGSLAGLGIIGLILTRNIIGLFIGVAVGLTLPSIVIKLIMVRRRFAFKGQLVDSLMILSSSLKAGLSLLQAIEELTTEMPKPISQEFGLVLRENRMGVPLEEALLHLKQRVLLEELDLIVTAILVARETGGDLTQTFSRLTFTIREKEKLQGRVKSLTAQGKLQGFIMIVLPIFFAITVFGMNPQFFDIMMEDKMGQAMLVYAVVSEIIGAFLIVKLSKIEV